MTLDVESTRATIVGMVEVVPPPIALPPPVLLDEPDAAGERSGEVGVPLAEHAAMVAIDATSSVRLVLRPDIFLPWSMGCW